MYRTTRRSSPVRYSSSSHLRSLQVDLISRNPWRLFRDGRDDCRWPDRASCLKRAAERGAVVTKIDDATRCVWCITLTDANRDTILVGERKGGQYAGSKTTDSAASGTSDTSTVEAQRRDEEAAREHGHCFLCG